MNRNCRSVSMGFVLGIIPLVFFALFGSWEVKEFEPEPYVSPGLVRQYSATCKVEAGPKVSTGVLLDTGFVLACGHGVDLNQNFKVDPDERSVSLEFIVNKKKVKCKGRVVIIGDDYSIIEPISNIRSQISASFEIPLIGEPVYTLGFPLAQGIHLTKGYQSSQSDNNNLERTSISAYMGNSGGSVFNTKGQSIGVLTRIGMDYRTAGVFFNIPLHTPDGIRMTVGRGQVRYMHGLPNWSEYVRNKDVYLALSKRGLGWIMVLEEEALAPQFNYNTCLKTFLQVWIVLMFASIFGRELFSR